MTREDSVHKILADADWWKERATLLNATVHGFSGRYQAGFIMADGSLQEIGSALAAELNRLVLEQQS